MVKKIAKLIRILKNDKNVVENWQEIYDGLELPDANIVTLQHGRKNRTLLDYDLFKEIIVLWESRNDKSSLIQTLEALLRELEFNTAADTICHEFKIPQSKNQLPKQQEIQKPVSNYLPRTYLESKIMDAIGSTHNKNSRFGFPIVFLYGMGGNGKSQLARQIVVICHKDENLKNNILWIDAGSELSDQPNDNLRRKLEQDIFHKTGLLIFDNANKYSILKNYLPLDLQNAKVSILVTSIDRLVTGDDGKAVDIKVDKFDENEFCDFVAGKIENVSMDEIKILDKYTGRYPYLANLVCSGFTEWKRERKHCDIKQYFERNYYKLLNGSKRCRLELHYERLPQDIVERQMNLIKEIYEEEGNIACIILRILAYCDTEAEKRDILNLVKNHKKLKTTVKDTQEIKEGIRILIKQGFLERRKIRLFIHQSYQHAIRNLLESHGKEKTEIEKLIILQSEYPSSSLNVALLWEHGIKYGNLMFEKMLNSSQFFPELLKHKELNEIQKLVDYAKSVKSEVDFIQWFLLDCLKEMEMEQMQERVKILLGANLERFELYIGNFGEFVKAAKKCSLEKTKLQKLFLHHSNVQHVAVAEIVSLELLVENYPCLLHEKFGDHEKSFLHIAAEIGKLETVQYLIDKNLEINATENKGFTPLHLATLEGSYEVVEALLKNNADRNIRDLKGWTPLDYASLDDLGDIAKCFPSNDNDIAFLIEGKEAALDIPENKRNLAIFNLLKLYCN